MNRGSLIRYALAALLLVAAFPLRAQYSLEILTLRHRTAQQVLPTLQPLVEPGGVLTGQGNQLLVRTSPANLAELRRALEAIDRPVRRLQISVRFDDSLDASRRSLGASGRIGSGGANVELRASDSASSAQERVDQRLQVLEGSRATIYLGQSRPVREQRYIQTPAGVISQQTTLVEDARMGFDVVPRIAGSSVQIEISTVNGVTAARGPVGEWFELGAVAATSGSRRVWVKVEALP